MKRLDLASRHVTSTQGDIGSGLGTSGRISFRDDRGADRDESGAVVTSAINRSLLASTAQQASAAGILVTESRPRRRRAQNLTFRESHEVIGEGGEPVSSDDDATDGDDDAAECAEPSDVLTPEERAFENLTKRNTDFNSISSNLSGKSRTLVDWVDENDQTTERSALTGRHKKFTPLVSVAPFSTGRGPGPLKVNAVAPMQNGELIKSSHRNRKEMVEKSRVTANKEAVPPGHKVTRLDDNVTQVDKVTPLDNKVTRLDDSPISSGDENKSNDDREDPSPDKPLEICNRADKPDSEANEGSSLKGISTGMQDDNAVPSEEGSKLRLRRTDLSGDQAVKPAISGRDESASKSEGISNISAIKSMLAEKAAAQKSGAQKRSHAQLQERNRARLNSLDGVSKHSRPKLLTKEGASSSTSGAVGSLSPSAPEACVNTGPAVGDGTVSGSGVSGVNENSGDVIAQTKPDRLCTNTGEKGSAEGNVMTNNAVTDTKYVASSKPALLGDKPRLTPKPAKAKALSRPINEDNGKRRLSLETSLNGRSVAPAQGADSRENAEKLSRLESDLAATAEAAADPAPSQLKPPSETEKKTVRLTKSAGDEIRSREQPFDGSQNKPSSYSPKSSIHHKDVETKQQRALKREQELERKREELERRNRDEKRAQERDQLADVQQERPQTSVKEEPSKARTRRDAPQPLNSSPPSPLSSVSAFHSQIKSDVPSRGGRDAEPTGQSRSRVVHPALQRAVELSRPLTGDGARSSASTDSTDDDDDDDAAPVAPQRTMSVSPRSRKRGSQAAVSFAAGTESGSRGGGVKPRSQSVPRPGLLDAGVLNDGEVRRRLAGGPGEERRSRRDEFRSRARFSLKKLLKFGRDDKRRDKDQVYGEFRAKPEIIHPIDRAGVGRVEVVSRSGEQRRREDDEDQRRRRQRRGADGAGDSPPTAPAAQKTVQKPGGAAAGHGGTGSLRSSTGLTPEGRPKPPPPPPPSSRQVTAEGSRPPQTPPTRPPPPNPQLLSRSRDGWGRGQPETDYANLGVSRVGLAPKKPDRHRALADPDGADADNGDVTAQPAQQAPGADPWRPQPSRLSLRRPAAAVPDRLQDSYDAVTASNLQALRQILNQVTHLPPGSERQLALRGAPGLALAQFQVAPQSRVALGRHVLLQSEHASGGEVVLLAERGAPLSPPLTVPALAQFEESVPGSLLSDTGDHAEVQVTVHVLGASRAELLSSLLAAGPIVTSEGDERAAWLLLLQAVWQLKALQARGQSAIDESLQQVIALHTDGDPHCRLVAVLLDGEREPRPLSACQAALCVLLMLLGVPEAAARARDGRGVSSVPDLPSSTRWELLASLLQRDDSASLRRAQRVLEFLLWAPPELGGEEAARWLHRERAALLGSVVRTQPRTIAEQLQLAFLVKADPDSLLDAAQLLSI